MNHETFRKEIDAFAAEQGLEAPCTTVIAFEYWRHHQSSNGTYAEMLEWATDPIKHVQHCKTCILINQSPTGE
jgi:hypothetical protein